MASNLRYGSRGSEVKDLQRRLNQQGYSLAEDGIFGNKTQAAVKDYQKNNNLAVDGIFGEQSRKMLFGSHASTDDGQSAGLGVPAPLNPTTTQGSKDNGFEYPDYVEGQSVIDANDALEQHKANKPGEYSSAWQAQLDDIMQKILGREDFSYDFNSDALYQQYKDKYIQQGKMAMQDTIGQASAMTGGYGNSYAATAGNQAYQASLQNLNDVIPELYQMAYDRYNQEGQELYNQYGLIQSREDQDYGRYQDSMSQYFTELDYLQGVKDSERTFDYGKWSDGYTMGWNEHRADVADEQWQTSFDEGVRQFDENMDFSQKQWDYQIEQAEKSTQKAGSGNISYSNGGDESGQFHQAVYRRTEGKYIIWEINGKEVKVEKGVNPYTGGKNSDAKYGTFPNGYQPNNVTSYYIDQGEGKNAAKKSGALTKSGKMIEVNGVTQNVWQDGKGKLWVWDGTQNKYIPEDQIKYTN